MKVIETWYRILLRVVSAGRDPALPEELSHLDDRLLRDIGYEPGDAQRLRGWDR